MTPIRFLPTIALPILLAACAPAADAASVQELALSQVNEARRAEGLPSLKLDETLNAAARHHAEDMVRRDYLAHRSPEGDTVLDRYLAVGGARAGMVAENIGRCGGCGTTPSPSRAYSFQQDWMTSPDHRENILHPGLQRFGYAMIPDTGNNGLVAVQTFAGPPQGSPSANEAAATAEEAAQLALERINQARAANGTGPLSLASDLSAALTRQLPPDLTAFDVESLEPPPPMAGSAGGRVFLAIGQCHVCGDHIQASDADRFIRGWLDAPDYAGPLLDARYDTLGFTLAADGKGRKIALAALAGR
jgi:uncharacterized protein YkwD